MEKEKTVVTDKNLPISVEISGEKYDREESHHSATSSYWKNGNKDAAIPHITVVNETKHLAESFQFHVTVNGDEKYYYQYNAVKNKLEFLREPSSGDEQYKSLAEGFVAELKKLRYFIEKDKEEVESERKTHIRKHALDSGQGGSRLFANATGQSSKKQKSTKKEEDGKGEKEEG